MRPCSMCPVKLQLRFRWEHADTSAHCQGHVHQAIAVAVVLHGLRVASRTDFWTIQHIMRPPACQACRFPDRHVARRWEQKTRETGEKDDRPNSRDLCIHTHLHTYLHIHTHTRTHTHTHRRKNALTSLVQRGDMYYMSVSGQVSRF